MAKKRREKDASDIKLKQPDRSGPTEQTLLQIVESKKLFQQAEERRAALAKRQKEDGHGEGEDDDGPSLPPRVERIMETLLWTISLGMLHFTLDVLVQHQYAIDINWWTVISRAFQAFLVFFLLFYNLHRHPSDPTVIPGLPARYQDHVRQAIFFAMSLAAGCYLIYVTNKFGYLAVMRQAPPVGCLWVWSVIELDLGLGVLSLACAGGFLWQGGYSIK